MLLHVETLSESCHVKIRHWSRRPFEPAAFIMGRGIYNNTTETLPAVTILKHGTVNGEEKQQPVVVRRVLWISK